MTTSASRWSRCLWHSTQARRHANVQIVPLVASTVGRRVVVSHSVVVPPVLPSRTSANSGSSSASQGASNDFKEAPEWVKLLLIFLTSAVVAFFEFAICKSAFRTLLSNCLALITAACPPGYCGELLGSAYSRVPFRVIDPTSCKLILVVLESGASSEDFAAQGAYTSGGGTDHYSCMLVAGLGSWSVQGAG